MNILHSAHMVVSPIHKEGYKFIVAFFVIAIILGFLWQPLFWLGLVVTLWCVYFFRDPERVIPEISNVVISPADGKVSFIGMVTPSEALGLPDEELLRISVFMDIFSCHVNRAPIQGKIKDITYRKGVFLNADLDKASESNEANSLLINTPYGDVGVVQIAGLVARRIVCWTKIGQELKSGQRFGLIRFGSRLDIYLPRQAKINVGLGQNMIAGETILAYLPDHAQKITEQSNEIDAPHFRID